MYYFVYCTWLDEKVLHSFLPEGRKVANAEARNYRIKFHAAGDRTDRGWCNLSGACSDAWGTNCLGIVVEHERTLFKNDYEDFERFALTVIGDDGKTYDCWSYRQLKPGIPMRPPLSYWQEIERGMKAHDFPQDYIDSVVATYEAAAPCPEIGPGTMTAPRRR